MNIGKHIQSLVLSIVPGNMGHLGPTTVQQRLRDTVFEWTGQALLCGGQPRFSKRSLPGVGSSLQSLRRWLCPSPALSVFLSWGALCSQETHRSSLEISEQNSEMCVCVCVCVCDINVSLRICQSSGSHLLCRIYSLITFPVHSLRLLPQC
jgi:hypothetical protein